jgi:glycosyltransferase involved in cell wall biosynthesis
MKCANTAGNDVEVVIPVFNGLPYIESCIASCLSQTLGEISIRVFDNASTDGTSAWLEKAARWESRIKVTRHTSNIGMIPNIRCCFEALTAPNFCFLCADDAFHSPSALEIALGVLESNPEVGVVYSDMAYIDANGKVIATRKFRRNGLFSARRTGLRSILAARNLFGIPVLTRSCHVAGAVFDEGFAYTPDLDLAISLADRCSSWHHPEVLMANRYHSGNASFELQRNAKDQFVALAARHGYALSAAQRFLVALMALATGLMRKAFMLYAATRHTGRASAIGRRGVK